MTNSMNGENKLEGASNYKAWKKRIDLIFTKHKVLNLVQGKKPTDEEEKEKFRETEILAMNLIVDGVKDNLIPYISNIDSLKKCMRLSPNYSPSRTLVK